MDQTLTLILSCEHGGNTIPRAYRAQFAHAQEALQSHRGWDPGALVLAERMSRELSVPLYSSTTSRLFVELNRSLGHPNLFSRWMDAVDQSERQAILAVHYLPYREEIQAAIAQLVKREKRVLHVSVHSFTPVLGDEVRTAEIGLLYDPRRRQERNFCARWQQDLRTAQPAWRIRRNYPYRGAADGLTTALRKVFPDNHYLGIELEVTQAWPLGDRRQWSQCQRLLVESLSRVLDFLTAE